MENIKWKGQILVALEYDHLRFQAVKEFWESYCIMQVGKVEISVRCEI